MATRTLSLELIDTGELTAVQMAIVKHRRAGLRQRFSNWRRWRRMQRLSRYRTEVLVEERSSYTDMQVFERSVRSGRNPFEHLERLEYLEVRRPGTEEIEGL